MVHAAATFPWMVTGSRPIVLPRLPWITSRTSSARTVRTRAGYALFSDAGRYVGLVTETAQAPSFGYGAATVLLRRDDAR